MNLLDLHEKIALQFQQYARKDIKTAINVLARSLNCSSPEYCLPEFYKQPLPTIFRLVEKQLVIENKSAHTIRNVKNNLSRFFRFADKSQVLILPGEKAERLHKRCSEKPRRPGFEHLSFDKWHLPFKQWPEGLQADFNAFAEWATAPVVEGRDAKWRKRESTIGNYRSLFETYYGYLHNIAHHEPLTFDDAFNIKLIKQFVYWFINERHGRVTQAVHDFLRNLMAITRQYRPDMDLRKQLGELKSTLPRPDIVADKKDAWVPLGELARIGKALWPTKLPNQLSTNGAKKAHEAGLSLMLQLWCYIPYRQRNIREMKLDENLYRDSVGQWRIKFAGEQLKVSSRKGQTNVFDLPFPTQLIPTLENYLETWRPVLATLNTNGDNHVFLNSRGRPYIRTSFTNTLKHVVWSFTDKHWHPHIVRTVWATEWIKNTHGDFYTAAIMLNDSLETVISRYSYLLDEGVAEKAYQLVNERMNGHVSN